MSFFNKKTIEDFLTERNAKQIAHIKNLSLYDHLIRVREILIQWGVDEATAHAGALHSVYSTQYFKKQLISSSEDKEEIIRYFGQKVEHLVSVFSQMNSETIERDTNDKIAYYHQNTRVRSVLSEGDSRSIIAIIFANQLDHVSVHAFGPILSSFQKIQTFRDFLPPLAQQELDYLVRNYHINITTTTVQYIAHAGVLITTPQLRVVIDPWLYSSTFTRPVLRSLNPSEKTIDFLVPEATLSIHDIQCDVILLSHYHTHHAPLQEIIELAKKRPLHIVAPRLEPGLLEEMTSMLGSSVAERITFHFNEYPLDASIVIEGVTIKCLSHTQRGHYAYHVVTEDTSIMHIVDAVYTKDRDSAKPDSMWEKFRSLRPDYLFLGAAPACMKIVKTTGQRDIYENTSLTPVQGAKLCREIFPKKVSLIGMDNFSIWSNRAEYRLPSEETYTQFYWAMSFLAPSVEVKKLYPGQFMN